MAAAKKAQIIADPWMGWWDWVVGTDD